jgi:hypothetical protein
MAPRSLQRQHAGGGFGHAAEGSDQIDLDGQLENVEREMFDLAGVLGAVGRFHGRADAGAIHQDALLAVGLPGCFEAGGDAIVAGDVDLAEGCAQFRGGDRAAILVTIEDGALHAFGAELLNRGSAEARRAARHNCRDIRRKTHRFSPSMCFEAL